MRLWSNIKSIIAQIQCIIYLLLIVIYSVFKQGSACAISVIKGLEPYLLSKNFNFNKFIFLSQTTHWCLLFQGLKQFCRYMKWKCLFLSVLEGLLRHIYHSNAHSNSKLPKIAFFLLKCEVFCIFWLVIELNEFTWSCTKRRLLWALHKMISPNFSSQCFTPMMKICSFFVHRYFMAKDGSNKKGIKNVR